MDTYLKDVLNPKMTEEDDDHDNDTSDNDNIPNEHNLLNVAPLTRFQAMHWPLFMTFLFNGDQSSLR